MSKELTLAEKFQNVWTKLYADDETREFLITGEDCKVMDDVETALKDYEKQLSIQNFIKKESVIFVSDDRIKCYFDIPKTKGNAELFDLLKEELK